MLTSTKGGLFKCLLPPVLYATALIRALIYGITSASIARASFCAHQNVFWHMEPPVDLSAATVVWYSNQTGNRVVLRLEREREREILGNKLKWKNLW